MDSLPAFYKNKKVLITGHTGFKGSWLAYILFKWGAAASGIALEPSGAPNLFEVLGLRKKIKNHFIDIRDYQKLEAVFEKEKPEIVFHLAAQAIVRDSYTDPLGTISINCLGTANVMHAIKETSCVKSAVLVTTDKVYENKEQMYAYRETDARGGHDPYSASKAAADIIIDSYAKSFFPPDQYKKTHQALLAVARAGNVVGGGDWARDRIIPDFMRAIFEKKKSLVIRNPKSIRPWQHVLEPLLGYLMLGHRLYEGGKQFAGAWNFGPEDQGSATVEELVEKSCLFLGRGQYQIKPDSSMPESNILKLDITKAKTLLGWRPNLSLDDTVILTCDWYKTFYEKSNDIISYTDKQIGSFFGPSNLNSFKKR